MQRNEMIDDKYLRFTRDQMRQHFLVDAESQIDYFEQSAKRYRTFLDENPDTVGIPLTKVRLPRQIEKDERFWTAASLKHIFDHAQRNSVLESILTRTFGAKPPVEGLGTWCECLTGQLSLYFEAQAPSPKAYIDWLRRNLPDRQLIPYIRDAAARESQRTLEGATHFDAALVNRSNGFALLIEAKVLSDISPYVSFDNLRNQMARCIDVMLEQPAEPTNRCLPTAFDARKPDRSLFVLLTPEVFRRRPQSRLYGWLLQEYRSNPEALARDLPHRFDADWPKISSRLGWITFEDIESQIPGACPWLETHTT
jgi:hypothetical protein